MSCANLRSMRLDFPICKVGGQPRPLPWPLPCPACCSPCWRCKAQARQAAAPASSGRSLFSFGFPGGYSGHQEELDGRLAETSRVAGFCCCPTPAMMTTREPLTGQREVSRVTQTFMGTEVAEARTVFSYPSMRLGPRPLSAWGQLRLGTGCVCPLKH